MNWNDYYKKRKEQEQKSGNYTAVRKPDTYSTKMLYDSGTQSKEKYTAKDLEPAKIQWKYTWADTYDAKDPEEQLRMMRGLPPKSVIARYDFTDKEDAKRFESGKKSKSMERGEETQKFNAEIKAYNAERQRRFDEVLKQKQAEADKSWDWFGLSPKKVTYIDPSEYEPEMPEKLSAWRGYLDRLEEYNTKVNDMDPSERAYKEAIGSMDKEPGKLPFDIPENLTWEQVQKDLWEEYQNRPLVSTETSKPALTSTPIPVVDPTASPSVSPTPRTSPLTNVGEFQRLQNQKRLEQESRPSPTPSSASTAQKQVGFGDFQALQRDKQARDLLYSAGDYNQSPTPSPAPTENVGFGDFQQLQRTQQAKAEDEEAKFKVKDILPFLKRVGVTAAGTISGGNVADTQALTVWANRMNEIQAQLGDVQDEETYSKLVGEYNNLLSKYQKTYQTMDTGNETANKVADTIGSLIGIGSPIPGAGFTKLEPFKPIGQAVASKVAQPLANLTYKAGMGGASNAAVAGLYLLQRAIPAGVGNAAQFSIMQAASNIMDPGYQDLSTEEKVKAVGNSALLGFAMGAGSAAINEAAKAAGSYAKPFIINKINPAIRTMINRPWIDKLLKDRNIAEIRVDPNGQMTPDGSKTGIYVVRNNTTGAFNLQFDGVNAVNVGSRFAFIRSLMNDTANKAYQTGSIPLRISTDGTRGNARPGAIPPPAPMLTEPQKASTPAVVPPVKPMPTIPVGTKTILKGLGEVEVISPVDDKRIRVRKADGKEIDVLKTAFASGMDSKATTIPVQTSDSQQVQTQDQAEKNTLQVDNEGLQPDTNIIDNQDTNTSSVTRINPNNILVDPKRFQFKQDVDTKTGTGKSLDIGKWDENLAGILLVWEDNSGNRYVVNGHHRLQKAKELGVNGINAMIIRESEGYTDKDAKLLGAKINIAEGHGSLTDAAKLFREGGYTLDQLKAEGLPMSSGNAQKGYAIAQLTNNLFNKVVSKILTENQGAIIGEKVPSDGGVNDARQEFILKQLINRDMSNSVLTETIDAILNVQPNNETQETLFGTELIWNTADFEIKPKIIAETKRLLTSNKNAFSKTLQNAEALKKAGNVLQDEANQVQKSILVQSLEFIDKGKYAKGDPIAEIFNKASTHVQAGGNIRTAAEQAAQEIVELIASGKYVGAVTGKMKAPEQSEIPGQISLIDMGSKEIDIGEQTQGGIPQSDDSTNSAEVPEHTETGSSRETQTQRTKEIVTTEDGETSKQPESHSEPSTAPQGQTQGQGASNHVAQTTRGQGQASNGNTVLTDKGIKVTRTTTKNGNPVWEISGTQKEDTETISAMKQAGGKWYGPKRAWSFYGEEDPTPKILDALGTKQPAETSRQNPANTVPDKASAIVSQYGRAGRTAFAKWTTNEYIMAGPGTERHANWLKVFDAYYNRGRSGEKNYLSTESPVKEAEIDFPPFVFDEIYKAGRADYEAQQKREAIKQGAKSEQPTPEVHNQTVQPNEIMLYHGSPIKGIKNLNSGTWFTEDKGMAERFASKKKESGQVYSVTVDLSKMNVLDMSSVDVWDRKTTSQMSELLRVTEEELQKVYKSDQILQYVEPDSNTLVHAVLDRKPIIDMLISNGHDVVKAKELSAGGNYINTYKILNPDYLKINMLKDKAGTGKNDTMVPKGEDADVRTTDQAEPERVPTETVPSASPGRGTAGVPGNKGERSRGTVHTSGENVSGSVSGTGGVRGEGTAEQLDTVNDNKAGARGDTSSGRGRNVTPQAGGNFRITDDMSIGSGGIEAKYKDNVSAIKMLKQLESENRKATPEEQKVLARYVGWGGMSQAFDEGNKKWNSKYQELKSLLTEDEYKAARASTPNAHYTDISVIHAMYEAVKRLGFDGGRILEPASGVGNFIGAVPESLSSSKFTGVELDLITGRIASQLYQNASIHVKGFEEVKLPESFFDLAISNVPFGNYKLHDSKYNKYNFFIHDYFFAKALDKVRPGGIVAFITSKGTMDKKDSSVRQYISERADLIGAIRLPNTTFQKNANTSVTTDVIFLQKRTNGQSNKGEAWLNIGQTADGVPVNEYYVDHPEMMLGTMVYDKSMYGGANETSLNPFDGDILQALKEAVGKLPQNVMQQADQADIETPDFESIAADSDMKENSYVLQNGEVYQYENGILHLVTQKSGGKDIPVTGKRKERIVGLISIREALHDVFVTQRKNTDEIEIKAARNKLNSMYDSFVKQNGHIEDSANKQAFGGDPDYWLLTTLEKYNPDTGKYDKADIMTKRTILPNPRIDKVGTSSEALAVSLNEKGKIDLARMAQLVNKTEAEITKELQGIIFKNPIGGTWETSDAYLSGNVRAKLRIAKEAANISPEYMANVKALEQVQPEDLKAHQIAVRLGANWIGADTVQDFVNDLLETNNTHAAYIQQNGSWTLRSNPSNTALYASKYGTRRMSAQDIIEKLLNMRQITVYDRYPDGSSEINKKETAAAREKAEVIKREFAQWIYKDTDRRQRLENTYNEVFNNLNLRKYDGSFLTFPGMSAAIQLRDYQKDVVSRILFGGNTLVAHAVGAGKTFEMIAAGMELKRLHIAHKPAYIVPNHMIEQWRKDFLKLYPNANVLAATKKDFEKNRRARFISMIATGDWDAVIISHSSFGKIGVSKDTEAAFIQEEIDDVVAAIQAAKEEAGNDPGSKRTVKELEKLKKNLEANLKGLLESENRDNYIDFEDLGIDYLFVDEAHNFKNLYFHTKMGRIAGVSNSKAKRASDMYMKTKYITGLHNNERGIVFATGTPISNSMPEMFTMQRYLAMPALEKAALKHFDAWASAFGETVSSLEVDKTGRGFRTKQRFSKFFNAPELVTMFRDFADVITSDMLNIERPTIEGGKANVISVDPSPELETYIDDLIERSDAVSRGAVDPREDNALKITNDGRLAALDMRLIDPSLPDDLGSKLNRAVEVIFKEWEDGNKERTAQLVFSDLGTPKDNRATQTEQVLSEDDDESAHEEQDSPGFAVNFDIYNDVKAKLIKMGVPENEIAFIHDAKTDIAKAKLFEKVRRGEVRILMGSTGKMGEGTNVQDRLIALHHLDAPWKPSSVEQRNGRIVRSGNRHKQVRIYHYVTKGSFDAYIWQLIENKARFISQMMNNKLPGRQIEDAFDEVVLNSAEIKAAASQDPRIMEKVKIDQEINNLEMLKSSHMSQVYQAQDYIARMPKQIASEEQYLANLRKDILKITDTKGENFVVRLKGKDIADRKEAGAIIQDAAAESKFGQPASIGRISGFELLVDKDAWADNRIIFRGNSDYYLKPTATEVGTVTAIENAIRGLPKEESRIVKKIQELRNRLDAYKEEAQKPFEHEARLIELYQKQTEINNALNLEKADNVVIDDAGEEIEDDAVVNRSGASVSRRTSENGVLFNSGVKSRTATAGAMEGTTSTANTANKPVSRAEIVDFIRQSLDIPITQGKFRQHALGIFKTHPEVIRLKDGKDIETLYHEVGHALDKWLSLMDLRFKGELMKLGEPASEDSYTDRQVMGEGIAEFVMMYIIQPDNAKAASPRFYAFFEGKVNQNQNYKDMLGTVQAATRNYIDQSPENRILGNVSIGPNKKKAILNKLSLSKLYTAAYDDLHPLKKAVDAITGGEKIDAQEDPFIRAWLFRGVSGKVEAILKYGPVDPDNNKIGKSFEEIIKQVKPEEMSLFRAYIAAKHAKELMDKDIVTGLNRQDVNFTIRNYDKQFEPVLKELVKFQNNVLKQLQDSGIISAESYDNITKAYSYYVPFNRVLEEAQVGIGKGYQARNPIYGIKGSTRDIVDPLESIIKNTFVITNMAERNMVGRAYVELAEKYEGSGKIMDKVPPRMIPQSFALDEIENVLRNAGIATEGIDLEQIATIFRPKGYKGKDNVITVFRDGKPEYFEVFDEDLYTAFKALDKETTPIAIEILSIPAKILRAGTTGLNPDFIGRNILRDTVFAGLSSKYGFIPFVDSIRGLAHVLKKDDIFQKWLYSGGGNAEMISVDRSRLQKNLRQLLEESGKNNALNIIRHPVEFIRALSEFGEQATRVGVFAKAFKKEGGDLSGLMMAGLASRETTIDFSRFGTSTKNINKMIAFFNAALQGSDTMVRAAMRDKGKFLLRSLVYITIPSIITYLLNRDDPEYEEIPQYQKDTFWLFKLGGQWFRIPKPYEIGMLMGSLPERFLAYVDKEDPRALDGWAEQFKDVILPDVIPTALLPLIEVWTNYDMFRNIPVVPESDKYKKPSEQYGPYTSSTAKWLGKIFSLSPRKVDHLIGGYGGGVGDSLANIAGKGLEMVGAVDKKVKPKESTWLNNVPIARGLIADPYRSSKSVDDFYDRLNELETDYKRMRDDKGFELNGFPKAKELRAMRKTQDELRDLRKEYNSVYADSKMGSKAKQEKLSKLNIEMINLARKAIGKPKIKQ